MNVTMENRDYSWPLSQAGLSASKSPSTHVLAAHAAVKRAASTKSASNTTNSLTLQDMVLIADRSLNNGTNSGPLNGTNSGSLSGSISGQASPSPPPGKMQCSLTGGLSEDSTATGHSTALSALTGANGTGSERSGERYSRSLTKNSEASTMTSSRSLRERRGLTELKVDTDRERNGVRPLSKHGVRSQDMRMASKSASVKGVAVPVPTTLVNVAGGEKEASLKKDAVVQRPVARRQTKRPLLRFLCGSWRRQRSQDSDQEYRDKARVPH
mmetsp:Transcript_6617/g.14412  ORF Transcript_6617/g.14412 Transcript_6617/m.14412 type:complete len:270 (+) Transcript_6617:117-926(+)|eukprot:CAMPEP_0178421342 /NCGR_PEP_ID=MMETSP0689_2-20121128/26597_1 /TAXON_ID=160604 /ORGANISM="Amphidinium massartii, Strain CS-259" /LENGTH=269 /DNA_ID=CAMNT_0020042849 /DNA_START=108 /DNA_END=917 /DNA_ORIENTATION=-